MRLIEQAPPTVNIPPSPHTCEDCTRPILGLDGIVDEQGKARHQACHERMERNGEGGLRKFSLRVTITSYTTVIVTARTAEEAADFIDEQIITVDEDCNRLEVECDPDRAEEIDEEVGEADRVSYLSHAAELQRIRDRLNGKVR
jgi:hypothetical protein